VAKPNDAERCAGYGVGANRSRDIPRPLASECLSERYPISRYVRIELCVETCALTAVGRNPCGPEPQPVSYRWQSFHCFEVHHSGAVQAIRAVVLSRSREERPTLRLDGNTNGIGCAGYYDRICVGSCRRLASVARRGAPGEQQQRDGIKSHALSASLRS
jgi:hypothetical protein